MTAAAISADHVNALIEARIAARIARDFAEADRLRAEIVALGVVLMDAKDPVTGDLSSTWRPAPEPGGTGTESTP